MSGDSLTLKGVVLYGLTNDMREFALDKIKRQKKYLSENGVEILGQSFRLIDFFKNSFINPDRYIAEVNNRVSSLYRYAKERKLKNVFLTITLPTEYHQKKGIYHPKTGKLIKVVNNPKFIDDEEHSPRAGSRVLSKIFNRIQQLRAYRNIPKENKVYFRVYEPHKDGTPHLHASIFIPEENVEDFVRSVQRWAFNNGFSKHQIKIETDIKNPVAYLMKYILKTFDDLRKDKDDITDLTLWYIVHGICRFYTSRTLISLEIYKKFRGAFDLLEVTKMYRNQEVSVYIDTHTKKPVMITHGDYVVYNRKPVKHLKKSDEFVPSEWKNKKPDYIPVEIDGKEAILNLHNEKLSFLSDLSKPLSKMSASERFYYRSHLVSELDNPFNSYDDLSFIEDRLIILDRFENNLREY